MAETDWTFLTDELNQATLDRGITTGVAPPNGGDNFIFAFNSLDTSQGAAGLFTNQAGFAPTPALKGGSIRGAVQRGVSAGDINHAPFLFIECQGTSVNDLGYILGLTDEEPHRIALVKGALVAGVPAGAPDPANNTILGRSTATFTKGTYLHLRLDCIVNSNGDVLLQAFQNDLVANSVAAPVWVAIPGLANFVDDQLGINSGSQPFTSGRMGFGFFTKDVSRRGFFDHVEASAQN